MCNILHILFHLVYLLFNIIYDIKYFFMLLSHINTIIIDWNIIIKIYDNIYYIELLTNRYFKYNDISINMVNDINNVYDLLLHNIWIVKLMILHQKYLLVIITHNDVIIVII